MMHEADAELKRDMTLLDIFQDAEYLKTKSKKDSGVGFDENGEEAMDYGGFDAPEDAPAEYGMGMMRSDTQMSFDTAGDLDSDMGHRKLLETPRPDSTRPESREMRVDTPMMMKGLQDVSITFLTLPKRCADGKVQICTQIANNFSDWFSTSRNGLEM